MPKKEVYPHLTELALYEKIIESFPGIERKGANVPYTSINGNMFSYLDKEGLMALRLPKEAIGGFIKKYNTRLCEAYGIVQREYVVVPASLLKNAKEINGYFKLSVDYAKSLKVKPSKK